MKSSVDVSFACDCGAICRSCLALAKLIQYALESHDSRLQEIDVQGDQILNMHEGIRTRSKSQQCEFLNNSLRRAKYNKYIRFTKLSVFSSCFFG